MTPGDTHFKYEAYYTGKLAGAEKEKNVPGTGPSAGYRGLYMTASVISSSVSVRREVILWIAANPPFYPFRMSLL